MASLERKIGLIPSYETVVTHLKEAYGEELEHYREKLKERMIRYAKVFIISLGSKAMWKKQRSITLYAILTATALNRGKKP